MIRKNWLQEEIRKASAQQFSDRTNVIAEDLQFRGVKRALARKKGKQFAVQGLFKSDIDKMFKDGTF